ncbi:MAG: metallophosphatase family protein [Euryarchaeota archaeon]|nr:metallophosphatase family protein [Euryarchaeota archaeon]MBU4491533.1 metallophosphatase family protein [Euryarchaeota archaeon]MCG2727820.1 metallophosphatase family protein [Candidatus Methanoperedenaceae archaeon]
MKIIALADMVIHAGDFVTKLAYDELRGICRLLAVHGNMDEAAPM